MRRVRIFCVCIATTALASAFSAPAMADALKLSDGRPLISGNVEGGGQVLHCHPAAEFGRGAEIPQGRAPGVILLNPHGGYKVTGPSKNLACEQVAAALGLPL